MMVGLALSLMLWQGSPKVVSSFDLLKDSRLTGRQIGFAKQHRWMMFGEWSDQNRDELRAASKQLITWRASDHANEELQSQFVKRWKSQLHHPDVVSFDSLTKDLVAAIPAQQFPIPKSPQSRWFRLGPGNYSDLRGESAKVGERLMQFAIQKWNDPNIRCYLLLRKTCGNLIAYLQIDDGSGEQLQLSNVKMMDGLDSEGPSDVLIQAFSGVEPKPIPLPQNKVLPSFESIGAKKLDLDGICREGFAEWFQAKVATKVGWKTRPTAVLLSDIDSIDFLRSGGNYESLLKSRGYQVVPWGGVDLIVSDNLNDLESIHVNEVELAQIDPNKPAGQVIEKYATWVDHSGLMASFDRLSYLEGALCWQRDVPLLSENIYPLLPVLAHIGKIDTSSSRQYDLVSTPSGALGNNMIYERIGDPFVLGPRLPSEMRIGYAWGPGRSERLTALTITSKADEQMYFKSIIGAPKNSWDLAEQLRAYGTTWNEIMLSAANKTVDVEQGELVTIAFQCATGRVLSGEMFFKRKHIYSGQFKDLPGDRLAKIREASNAINEGMKDEIRTPPPLQWR